MTNIIADLKHALLHGVPNQREHVLLSRALEALEPSTDVARDIAWVESMSASSFGGTPAIGRKRRLRILAALKGEQE